MDTVLSAALSIHGYLYNNPKTFWTGLCGLTIGLVVATSILRQDRISPKRQANYRVIRTRQRVRFTQDQPQSNNNDLNNTVNIRYENKYIHLSYGQCYTEQWTISNTNSTTNKQPSYHMLCVHGFSMPDTLTTSFIPCVLKQIKDDKLINIKSIVAFHLYGRGLSDAPLIPNTLSLFLSQLCDIITCLQLDGPLILCGLSMGGAIVVAFANRYPHRVHKLCAFAPAGITVKSSLGLRILTLPLMGDVLISVVPFVFRMAIKKGAANGLNADKYGKQAVDAAAGHLVTAEAALMHHDGYLYSLLSTLRYFPLSELMSTFEELYEREDFENRRWIFVWGEDDSTCPMKADSLFPDVKILKISGAEHGDIVHAYCIQQYGAQFVDFLNERL